MSQTLTPTSPSYIPSSITAAADGDDANAASLVQSLQPLLDAVTVARLGIYGQRTMPDLVSLDGATVDVSACPSLVLTSSSNWYAINSSALTFSVSHLEGGGAFANSTWYYMYYYLSGGAVTRQISLTAPNADRRYKGTSTDYAYVGCFKTNSSGAIINFGASRGVYSYNTNLYGLAVLTNGTATMATDVNLAIGVPPHSRMALLDFYLSNESDASVTDATVLAKGASQTGFSVKVGKAPTGSLTATHSLRVPIATDSSQKIQYLVSGVGTPKFSVTIGGFIEQ